MVCAPLEATRWGTVTDQRTKRDGEHCSEELLDVRYPTTAKMVLVMDNRTTPAPSSLDAAFPLEKAKRLADRLEIHLTPKHGSWLNVAEIELSVLSRPCLDRRIPDKPTLLQEVTAWEQRRNCAGGRVDWRFRTTDARSKLKHLYPTILV
jgi:hypothetical protein